MRGGGRGAAIGAVCVFALSLALACARPPGTPTVEGASAADAGYVGDTLCRGCHYVEASHWDKTIHARAFKANPRTELESKDCEACHGPGQAHVANPSSATIQAFS